MKLIDKVKGNENLIESGNHPAGHLFEWTQNDIEHLLKSVNLNIYNSVVTRPPKEFFRSSKDKYEHRVLGRLSEFSFVNFERISSMLSKNLHAKLFHAKYFAFAECKQV